MNPRAHPVRTTRNTDTPGRLAPLRLARRLVEESVTLSCGARIHGKTGGTNSALSAMAATRNGTP
ncbi:hypothetical protein [Streptomyces sp. PU-14G]|uniref:hypothetical protein n=1 Tax=Streptomyces sp. PU-14G TaxID=2800808 RepID=UPI0034DF55BE